MKIRTALVSLGMALVASVATASEWPDTSKPIKVVVPFAAGGGTDVVARLLSEKLAARIGMNVVVENRGGQNGSIGAAAVARAEADGYTIMFTAAGPLITNPLIYDNLTYDADTDFAPIIAVASTPNVLVVNPAVDANDVSGLIAVLKDKPGSFSFASSGNGSPSHLAGELFGSLADVDMKHIPYQGSSPALLDVMGGRVEMMFDSYISSMPLVDEGKLKLLAVTTAERLPDHPDVPAVNEVLPGFEVWSMIYFVGPANMPEPIVARVNKEVGEILLESDIAENFKKFGLTAMGGTPEELGETLVSERAKWGPVVEKANIRSE